MVQITRLKKTVYSPFIKVVSRALAETPPKAFIRKEKDPPQWHLK